MIIYVSYYYNITINNVNMTTNLDKDQLYIKYGFGINNIKFKICFNRL